jgi:hypothetical protein
MRKYYPATAGIILLEYSRSVPLVKTNFFAFISGNTVAAAMFIQREETASRNERFQKLKLLTGGGCGCAGKNGNFELRT